MSVQDWWQIVALVAGALGLKEIVIMTYKSWTGRASRQKAELNRMAKERDAAIHERDKEASMRRRLQESLSEHRSIMYAAPCIPNDSIPKYPE